MELFLLYRIAVGFIFNFCLHRQEKQKRCIWLDNAGGCVILRPFVLCFL